MSLLLDLFYHLNVPENTETHHSLYPYLDLLNIKVLVQNITVSMCVNRPNVTEGPTDGWYFQDEASHWQCVTDAVRQVV